MECEFPSINSNKQEVKEIFKIAQTIAMQLSHNFLGTEHLLLALLSSSDSFAPRLGALR